MRASRQLIDAEPAIATTNLRLLRGSNTVPARNAVTKRDGRIRLVRDRAPESVSKQDDPAVERAHVRLRLPSLEQWLSARIW
jgi:hypothetical protein